MFVTLLMRYYETDRAVAYEDFLFRSFFRNKIFFAAGYAFIIFSGSKLIRYEDSLSVYNRILKTDQYFIYCEGEQRSED